jgi:hypothetical protein
MTDPYSTQEESNAVLFEDTRSPAQKKLDKLLDERGAWEMGNNQFAILYQIATELLEGKIK